MFSTTGMLAILDKNPLLLLIAVGVCLLLSAWA